MKQQNAPCTNGPLWKIYSQLKVVERSPGGESAISEELGKQAQRPRFDLIEPIEHKLGHGSAHL